MQEFAVIPTCSDEENLQDIAAAAHARSTC